MHRLIQTCHLAVHHWPMDAQLTFAHTRVLPAMHETGAYSESLLLYFTGCLACDLGDRPPWASTPLYPPMVNSELKSTISMCAYVSFFFSFPLEIPCVPSSSYTAGFSLDPPSNVSVVNVTGTSITISWEPISCLQRNSASTSILVVITDIMLEAEIANETVKDTLWIG